VEAAEAARADAVEAVDDLLAKLKSARRRYEKLLESLHAAERELNAADTEHAEAETSAREAADALAAAKAELAEADSALADLG
jgi:chromosome segregation ATPase